MAPGAPGAQVWVPDDSGDREATSAASASGSLATSGRDDQERGDTVSGLGLNDAAAGGASRAGEHAVEPGQQSGGPTPGNRFPEPDEQADQ